MIFGNNFQIENAEDIDWRKLSVYNDKIEEYRRIYGLCIVRSDIMRERVRFLSERYKGIINMILFMIGYMAAFSWLEQRNVRKFHVIHVALDDVIPFCEYFIVPYLLWFIYVAAAVIYINIQNQDEGRRFGNFLMVGMTVFIIISTIFPNCQLLRPRVFAHDNIFVDMVKTLYRTDTSTNILPSIHAFNSIAVMIALYRDERCKRHRIIQGFMMLLGISIILATVFLKQHSVIDVFSAMGLSVAAYMLCYKWEPQMQSRSTSVSPLRTKL